MAEPDEPLSQQDDTESLGILKVNGDGADEESVEDASGARPRWNWDPVTDTGGTPRADDRTERGRSSFQFDLGSALARFDGDEPKSAGPQHSNGDSVEAEGATSQPTAEPTAPLAPVARESSEPSEPTAPQSFAPSEPVATPQSTSESVAPESFVSSESVAPESFAPSESAAPGAAPLQPSYDTDSSVADVEEPFLDGQPLPRRTRGSASHDAVTPAQNAPLPERQHSQSQPSVFGGSDALAARHAPVQPAQLQPQHETEPQYRPHPAQAPATPNQPQPSVFDPGTPAPALPPRLDAGAPAAAPVDTRARSATTDPVVPPTTAALPTLPAANPAAPPPVAAPIDTAPSTPDINALRSAQLRANRQQRQGKVFARTLLAFIAVGGLIAAALVFGRSYLFTTEWDATLTPIVDDIQESTGVEFDHTVPLIEQPADEYASKLLDATLGQDWVERVPEWRALGLASGDITPSTVSTVLVERSPAFYDPVADTIFQLEGADPEAIRPALETAMLAAFDEQAGGADSADVVETSQVGLTGVSTPQTIARDAVDTYIIRRTAGELFEAQPIPPTSPDVPVPVAYELAGVDRLGEAILVAAGTDPATVGLGDTYPDAIYGALDDNPVRASGAVLLPGDSPLADAVALGVDDWSLVWGTRLPGVTVTRLVGTVTADSYQPVNRGGATCFVTVFRTSTEANGTSLFNSMLLWAQRAPIGSQALATQLGPTVVQLEACDPGGNISFATGVGTVNSLIDRQLDRLAN